MNQSGNNPHAPQTGQTLVQGGQPQPSPPQYVPASPPGVAVALPNAQQHPGHGQYAPPASPAYGSQHAPAYPQAQSQQYLQQQQAAPAQPKSKPAARQDELLPNVGRTVYEFRGEHSEEARSGGRHQTFFADDTNLANLAITEDRQHSNLKSGGSNWIIAGLVIVVVGGLTAFFLYGAPSDEANDSKEDDAQTEAASPPAPADPAAPEAPAAAGPEPAVEGTAPEQAPPAEEPKPAEEPAPAPAPAPAEEKAEPAEPAKPAEEPKPAPKKKSSPTKKKTEPKKTPSITPSRPPRSNLDGLPAPD